MAQDEGSGPSGHPTSGRIGLKVRVDALKDDRCDKCHADKETCGGGTEGWSRGLEAESFCFRRRILPSAPPRLYAVRSNLVRSSEILFLDPSHRQ